MQTTRVSRAQQHKHMIVRTPDGERTSISIPTVDVERYIATCYGSRTLFRRHLNAAVTETPVRPGRSRSQLVRASLDERMRLIQALQAN